MNVSKRHRMRSIVSDFQHYVETYSDQPDYEDYSDKTYIENVLYGIGLSLNFLEYSGADGFRRFKKFLREHLAEGGEP